MAVRQGRGDRRAATPRWSDEEPDDRAVRAAATRVESRAANASSRCAPILAGGRAVERDHRRAGPPVGRRGQASRRRSARRRGPGPPGCGTTSGPRSRGARTAADRHRSRRGRACGSRRGRRVHRRLGQPSAQALAAPRWRDPDGPDPADRAADGCHAGPDDHAVDRRRPAISQPGCATAKSNQRVDRPSRRPGWRVTTGSMSARSSGEGAALGMARLSSGGWPPCRAPMSNTSPTSPGSG